MLGLDFADGSRDARRYAARSGVSNLAFVQGDVYALPFRDATVDAVLAHSILETLADAAAALRELHRVLKAGGVVGVAAVDYTGLLLTGPSSEILERFYWLKEQYWQRCLGSEPRRGRQLRSLLSSAGFISVQATARYVSYGTGDAIHRFGEDRARECAGPAFVEGMASLGLSDSTEFQAMGAAWRAWGESADAFLAFPWCNAVGWK